MTGGLFRSENSGRAWRQIFDPAMHVYSATVHPRNRKVLYASTANDGLYRTKNGGKTWEKVEGCGFHFVHRVFVDPHDPDRVYATTFGGGVFYGPAF